MEKYVYGHPFDTQAVVNDVDAMPGQVPIGVSAINDHVFTFDYVMDAEDIVYGLGEQVRGINKRGWEYISWATDEPHHHEDKRSLYSAHNFLIVSGKKTFGLFVDYPGRVRFDIGYTHSDVLHIECEADLKLYYFEGEDVLDISRQFRHAIGKSYVAPKFAFGYGQSRWGYKTQEDFKRVVESFESRRIPLDLLYMDIDYMQDYKDFTLNEKEFEPDFQEFVDWMKEHKVHLVPIIDAGVKMQDDYCVYEEGKKNNYFCKLEDHTTDFIGAVWPGYSMMPDFLNDQARNWFGMKYETLTKYGIDAFWNDMNEPALFYSRYGIDWLNGKLKEFLANEKNEVPYFKLGMEVESLKNSMDDYRRFYHNTNQGWVRHDKVHNLYGCSMTRSASEAFETLRPGKRTLMFSRSSYIGMHRYGGIWTGDNKSWWSHLDLIVHQLPAINMAGFLYTGPDLGGFGEDTTRDLLMRFLQIGIFTPLMRNHSAIGTREQEPYQFERSEEIARLIRLRYRLIPYLYSEYLKAVENDTLLFKALAFEFKEDVIARSIEDQLLLGDQIMIAPVTRQNEPGRPVYLPEPMTRIVCSEDGIEQTALNAGWHYISYPLDSLVFFVRCSQAVPLGAAVLHIDDVNLETIEWLGDGTEYELYEDDGISANAPITRTLLAR